MSKFLNEYKITRQVKWSLAKLFRPFFDFQYTLFRNRINKKNKIRMFFSTGNISLINILALLKSLPSENYDDILIVNTGLGRKAFIEQNLEIIKLYNFKKVFFIVGIDMLNELVVHNFSKVDEIYVLNHPVHLNVVNSLYSNTPLTLLDEGCGSLINYNLENYKNVKRFITHKYINKFDFWGLKNYNFEFKTINIEHFRQIAITLSKQNPITFDNNNEDKYILFCATYWQVSGLDKETFAKLQTKMINKLLEKGYKILYKPHPRETEIYGYEENQNLYIINSRYPIELYNLDILAIVSTSCSALINYPHYWDVPAFSNVINEAVDKYENEVMINLIRYIISQYTLNYKALLDFDVKNTPKEVLKQKIKVQYDTFLETKPLLSQNKEVERYEKKMERNNAKLI